MMNKLYIAILITVCLFSCNKDSEWYQGDYFFLKNKEAVMPIWVTGNIDSDVFIITNHDGPGNTSGHDYHKSVGFQQLEKKYAVVYWDQRMSGLSQGNAKYEELTIGLHVEDLQKIVTLIKARYNPRSLFLYGNGWGGGIATAYLAKNNNQSLFKGFIDESGFIKDELEQEWKREWIINKAQNKIAASNDDKWLKMINWYENNPNPTEADKEPFEFVHELGGYYYDEENVKEINQLSDSDNLLNSPYSVGWRKNQYSNRAFIAGYNFEDDAKKLTLPTLVIWGINNGAVPLPAAKHTINTLGTPVNNKDLVEFNKCGHYPYLEKPNEWYNVVNEFIASKKN